MDPVKLALAAAAVGFWLLDRARVQHQPPPWLMPFDPHAPTPFGPTFGPGGWYPGNGFPQVHPFAGPIPTPGMTTQARLHQIANQSTGPAAVALTRAAAHYTNMMNNNVANIWKP